MKRILVIRGGAIGDFILTLPALKALRDAYPSDHIEVLGYRHIAELVNNRFYANAIRSIEYAALSSFFTKGGNLSPEWIEYFANFDLIITYLYDPDLIFENNLRRCGAKKIIQGPAKISGSAHAAYQLAEPLEEIGRRVADFGARLYPSKEDQDIAREFLKDMVRPVVAIHPGSGSEKKNWPIENWIKLGNELLTTTSPNRSLLVVSGEADEKQTTQLESVWRDRAVRFAKSLPLAQLAAILEGTTFLGHDSGISHLAAAAGAKCILLFGETDPDVWAPMGENVQVVRAPGNDLQKLSVAAIADAVRAL